MDVLLLRATPDFATAVWRDVIIHVHRASDFGAAVAALAEASQLLVERGQARLHFLLVIEHSSAPPPVEARSALMKLLSKHRDLTKAYLVVAEGGGFRAATVRAVGTALSMLAPKSFPFVIVESVAEAAERLHRVRGGTIQPQPLLDAIGVVRAAIVSRAAR